ncbi:MAG TPA: L,D-transpeptidase family protein [Chthoniobacterales bacterium]|nr:L,D-transpeptidase family protein [Chthoniobacterales bacterium]
MRSRRLALVLLACAGPIVTGRAAARELDRSLQCLVVLTEDWTSTTGVLRSFERNGGTDKWKERHSALPVVVGKKGLGLGRGVVRLDLRGAPRKKEGDDKAPVGIFRLSTAFGYAPARSATWARLPYLALTKRIEGIDDPRSLYYNRLVDRSKVAKIDWRSSEQMRRDDVLYKWGIVVDHNAAARPGAGSCIFLHVWKSPSSPTAGCTAMRERDLVSLIRWLDPTRHPILVQMPREVYRTLRTKYDLPPDSS